MAGNLINTKRIRFRTRRDQRPDASVKQKKLKTKQYELQQLYNQIARSRADCG